MDFRPPTMIKQLATKIWVHALILRNGNGVPITEIEHRTELLGAQRQKKMGNDLMNTEFQVMMKNSGDGQW